MATVLDDFLKCLAYVWLVIPVQILYKKSQLLILSDYFAYRIEITFRIERLMNETKIVVMNSFAKVFEFMQAQKDHTVSMFTQGVINDKPFAVLTEYFGQSRFAGAELAGDYADVIAMQYGYRLWLLFALPVIQSAGLA